YMIPVDGGNAAEISDSAERLADKNISPDGRYKLYHEEVKLAKVHGRDYYPDLEKSNVQIFDGLDYRHWDTWNEGKYNHIFFTALNSGKAGTDIMKDEPYDSPQKPFGGDEDYIWSPDSRRIIYVAKK